MNIYYNMFQRSESLKDNHSLVYHTKTSELVDKSATILVTCNNTGPNNIRSVIIFLFYLTASHVHACEWNPDAVAALRRGIERNKVTDRCTVYPGDNAMVSLTLSYRCWYSAG